VHRLRAGGDGCVGARSALMTALSFVRFGGTAPAHKSDCPSDCAIASSAISVPRSARRVVIRRRANWSLARAFSLAARGSKARGAGICPSARWRGAIVPCRAEAARSCCAGARLSWIVVTTRNVARGGSAAGARCSTIVARLLRAVASPVSRFIPLASCSIRAAASAGAAAEWVGRAAGSFGTGLGRRASGC
jgi:hypothetical protein